eukprot:c26762_g3_i1 orf=392-1549(+)
MTSFVGYVVSGCWRPVVRSCEVAGEAATAQDLLLWHKDLKQHALGDFSMAVLQANRVIEDQSQVHTGRYGTYIGVYDGHGGPEASRFIASHLFPKIRKFTREKGGMSSEVLKKAFRATEEEFAELVDKTWRSKPGIAAVGSCCLAGVISGSMLYVGNLGDSRAVLASLDKKNRRLVAKRLSADHNANNEEVREELKAQHPDDSNIVVITQGIWRVKGIIQVSRSIGDVYLKKPELNRDPLFMHIGSPVSLQRPVLTAEPSTLEHMLKPHDRFLIFASDGLWELLGDQQAVDIVGENPRMGIAKRLVEVALQAAARRRELRYSDLEKIECGSRRCFHDDISVVVIYLDHDLIHINGQGSPHRTRSDFVNSPVDVFSSLSLKSKTMA